MFVIDDGYTLPFEASVPQSESVAVGLEITGQYRPPLFEVHQAFLFAHDRAMTGEEQVTIAANFISERLVSWDVKLSPNMTIAPTTAEYVRRLPLELVRALVREVSKWAPRIKWIKESSQAVAEGN